MFDIMGGLYTQEVLLPRTIRGANEATSEYFSDDKKLTPENQDLYLQNQSEKHREQNQAFRQAQELREAAIRAGRWGSLGR